MDYMPPADGKKVPWLANMEDKLPEEGPKFGMTTDQITEIQTLCKTVTNKIHLVENTWASYKSALDARDAMDIGDGDLKLMRAKISQWKTADGFNSSIGNALGIMAEKSKVDVTNYKATLAVAVIADVVRLKFKKVGADGINIYKRKKGSIEWAFLTRATKSPFDDKITLAIPGQPEHWEYVAYGVKKDAQIGSPSDIIQIIYGGIA